MKSKNTVIIVAGLIFVSFLFVFSKQNEKLDNVDYQKEFNKNYAVYSLSLPDEITFAGEKVPLDHFDVREALDQEMLINTYWQSQTLLFIKRAHKYFPRIEKILAENNIPDDFKYLALVESDLKNAISPSGAVGVWQLLKGTATDYGLEVNSEIDERYHFEKSTKAACEYFKDAHELFGSWTMAAASYNMGRRGLIRQVNRQKQDNYYDLLLNNETGRYVYRILAIKLILENPEKYGFHVREKDFYHAVPTYEVELDTAVSNFADFAEKFSINYKVLKYFNPWLRDSYLTNNSKKEYLIKIPEEGFRSYTKMLDHFDVDTTALSD
jgi:membrane-bound lytic murein transglycosylase D